MTDVTAAPTAAPSPADLAYAAAKAEALGTPPPAPAPAPAPAAPAPAGEPAPAPAPEAPATAPQITEDTAATETPLEAASGADGVIEYTPTGDPGMDVALGFIGKLGLGPDHPAMKAAEKGDFAILKATLAALGDKAKGWESMVALGERSYNDAVSKATANETAIGTAVLGVMGTKETQAAVLAWAAKTASPQEKAYFNEQLRKDPLAARVASAELLRLYQGASGTVVNPARVTNGDTPNYSEGPKPKLTRAEYSREVDKLAKKYGGGNLSTNSEYAALNARYRNQ